MVSVPPEARSWAGGCYRREPKPIMARLSSLRAHCVRNAARRLAPLSVESLECRLPLDSTLGPIVSVVRSDTHHSLFGPRATAVTEGESLAADVRLRWKPGREVTVTIESLAPLEVNVPKTTLTFTRADWNKAQTVTFTAVQDRVADGNTPVPISVHAAWRGRQSRASTRAFRINAVDSGAAGSLVSVTSGEYRGAVFGAGNTGKARLVYDAVTNHGSATICVTMPRLDRVRGRLVTVGFSVRPDGGVTIESLGGVAANRLRLHLQYRSTPFGDGFSGTITVLQPILRRSATANIALGLVPAADGSDTALRSVLEGLRLKQGTAWGVVVPGFAAATEPAGGAISAASRAVSGAVAPPGTQKLRLEDRFHVGSVTKTFTAALIMQLDQEGLLSIHDPISHWIDFPGGDGVTIAMLLGHTSGIPDFTGFPYERDSTPEQSIALVAGRPFVFAPGTAWAYSNTNYTILGLIAEKATSTPWADLVASRFFGPLGLHDTYVWSGTAEGPTATGSRLACGGPSEPACVPPRPGFEIIAVDDGFDWKVAWSAGAIVSTPADLAKWMVALVAGDVLDAAHRDLMKTPSPQSLASDFGEQVAALARTSGGALQWTGDGLGLFEYTIEGLGTAWGHEGSINGFVTNAAYVDSLDHGIAVVSNFAESDSFSALGAVAVAMGRRLG